MLHCVHQMENQKLKIHSVYVVNLVLPDWLLDDVNSQNGAGRVFAQNVPIHSDVKSGTPLIKGRRLATPVKRRNQRYSPVLRKIRSQNYQFRGGSSFAGKTSRGLQSSYSRRNTANQHFSLQNECSQLRTVLFHVSSAGGMKSLAFKR